MLICLRLNKLNRNPHAVFIDANAALDDGANAYLLGNLRYSDAGRAECLDGSAGRHIQACYVRQAG